MRVKYDIENYCTRCDRKWPKTIDVCLACHFRCRTVSHQPLTKFPNGNKNESKMKRY